MAFGLSAGAALALGAGGAMLLGGGADTPDTSGMNQAAVDSAKVSADTLAWYKEKDAADKPMRDKLANKAYEVADQQLASSKASDALAADYSDYNKTTFRPLEQGIVADAQNYDTPEKRQAAADAAMADTNMAFGAANKATAQQLAANGIDPGSTRAMSVMEGQGVNQATANAGAAFKARKGVESVGHAMQMDAASLGRNLPSAQATAAQNAIQAGNSSVSNTGAPLTASNQGAAAMNHGFNTALQGNQIAGNLYGQQAQIQNTAATANNGLWQAAGTVAGAYLAKSDENIKSDISNISDEEALAATNDTPVKKWRYDPSKMAAQGIPMEPGDQGEQIGPMAQKMNETMGEEAAPGGKKINLVTANGINMKSIQAVDKKVVKLTKQVSSLAAMIRGGQVQAGAQA